MLKQQNNCDFYRLIAEYTSDFISINELSPQVKFIYLNPSFAQLGYDPKKLAGKSGLDFIHPDDLKCLQPLLKKYLAFAGRRQLLFGRGGGDSNKISQKIEFRFKAKNGQWRVLRSTVDLVGKDKLLFVSQDITKSKELAQKLKAEKERTEKYLDIAGTIILALNVEGKVILINKKGCEALGVKKQAILGRDWFANFIPPGQQKKIKEVFQRIMSGQEKKFAYFENEIISRQGQRKIIAWHNVLLKDKTGKIECVLSSGQDITERRKMEDHLRDFANKWEETINFISSGISVHANDFTIIEANNSLSSLLNKSREQIIGHKCYQIFHSANQPIKECPLLKSLKTKNKESLEYYEPVLKKWLSVATVPILDQQGGVKKTIHEVNDITERKQVEIEIKKRNEELEKANKLMVGRELRMIELKKEINELKQKLIKYGPNTKKR